jgi:sulfate transport system ATP-binding protein
VFQHYALFRHMSVFENIAFGLRVRPTSTRPSNAEIRDRVMKLLHLVQLDGLEKRFPTQLSGGQRQRVALARALAVEPKVLLLDEPFGALDAKVRKELRRWLRKLHEEIHVTSIFVTHDQEEALELADRVVIMNLGQIEQVGTPEQVYDMPANSFVYQFLGSVNTLAASVLEGKASIGGQTFTVENGSQNESDGVAFIRPHEFELLKAPNGGPALPGRVRHIQPVGSVIRVEVLRDDTHESLDVEVTREHFKNLGLKVHDKAWLRPHRVQVYPPDFSI